MSGRKTGTGGRGPIRSPKYGNGFASRSRRTSGLEARTLFEALQRQHPGKFADGQLRTLQRRLKHWRATAGPEREVFFGQQHVAGRLGQSDFTRMGELNITIGGQSFPHLLYHFVLTYSNWEDVSLCYSESFESLSDGLQNALWELGGAPLDHRTDRMSLAVNNASDEREFTTRYEALLRHYKMTGQKIQAGKANENGDVEQRHYRLKRAVDQSLLLRDGRDFPSVDEYKKFVRALVTQLNAGRRERLRHEMQYLSPLPAGRLESMKRERVKVDSGSLIYVDRNVYSVHSRLIGEKVGKRGSAPRLWKSGMQGLEGGRTGEITRPRQAPRRLPAHHRLAGAEAVGAFENYRYRAELFPTSRFPHGLGCVAGNISRCAPTNWYVWRFWNWRRRKERFALMKRCAVCWRWASRVRAKLNADTVQSLLLAGDMPLPATSIDIVEVSLSSFDELLCGTGVLQ